MSAIAADYFRQNALLVLPIIALVLFIAVFLLVTIRTLCRRAESWEAVARLPLEDDGPEGVNGKEARHE